MDLMDGNYKFLLADIGGFGNMSNSRIFHHNNLEQCIDYRSIAFWSEASASDHSNHSQMDIQQASSVLMHKPYKQG